jgi:hypothetical protein
MSVDVGNQSISLKFGSSGNSREINRRFVGIRPTGIYSGGYLTVVDASHASLSALIAEIEDGTHQLRIATTTVVSTLVSSAIPYIVLRWAYTGNTSDFMEILAVSTPATYDLIVGKCTFTGGGVLNGFVYSERSNPEVLDLFLQVEASETAELRVRIRGGRIQNGKENIDIPDQKSGTFIPPGSNSRIDLVYVDRTAGTIAIDSSGTAAATPVAPSYAGRLILAEVTLSAGDLSVASAAIKDVRDFVNMNYAVDDTTIQVDANGKLAVKTITASGLTSLFGDWLVRLTNTIYQATTDGFVVVYLPDNSHISSIVTDANNPPTTSRMAGNEGYPSFPGGAMCPVKKNHYWKVNSTGSPTVYWLPLGS